LLVQDMNFRRSNLVKSRTSSIGPRVSSRALDVLSRMESRKE
jgi:hypothetical protein